MKHHILKGLALVALFASLSGCYFPDLERQSVDPTLRPEVTQRGKGTFYTVLDNWVYSIGRYLGTMFFPVKELHGAYTLSYNERENTMDGEMMVTPREDEMLTFTLVHPEEGGICLMTNIRLAGEPIPDVQVKITRLDRSKRIVAGQIQPNDRFKEGFFDLVYEAPR